MAADGCAEGVRSCGWLRKVACLSSDLSPGERPSQNIYNVRIGVLGCSPWFRFGFQCVLSQDHTLDPADYMCTEGAPPPGLENRISDLF